MDSAKTLQDKFNSLNKKSMIHAKDLELFKKYPITNAKRVTTKYGGTLLIDLENNIMYLPNRYNELSDEDIKELSNGAYGIYREGERNLILYKLKESENFIIQNSQYPIWT